MKKYILLFAIGTALLQSCINDGATIIGNETITTEDISVKNINSIDLSGNYNVTITQGATYSLQVIAESNIYDALVIEENNGQLSIKQKDNLTLQPSETIEIYITAPSIEKISNKGSIQLTTTNTMISNESFSIENAGTANIEMAIKANQVAITNSGAGALNLSGTANTVQIKSSGAANIDAAKLIALEATIDLSGAGNADIYASQKLKATISGVGNITYYGSPLKIDKKINGLGNIAAND